MSGKYDDIIDLPHPSSATRPRMCPEARAAQFAPFAALSGYDDAVAETARWTQQRPELDEYAIAALDMKLQQMEAGRDAPVCITWFQPDGKKSGGALVSHTGPVRRVDDYAHAVLFADGTRVPIGEILEITLD